LIDAVHPDSAAGQETPGADADNLNNASVSEDATTTALELNAATAFGSGPVLGDASPWQPISAAVSRLLCCCLRRRRYAVVAHAASGSGGAADAVLPGPAAGNLHLLPFPPAGRTTYRVLLDSDGTTMDDDAAARWAALKASHHATGSPPNHLHAHRPASSPIGPAVQSTRSISPNLLRASGSEHHEHHAEQLLHFGGVALLRCEVVDNGTGITPEAQANLFAAFQQIGALQAGAAQTAALKGTGLGLYICRQLVRRHGGRVGVSSSGVPGEPTVFWFEVPVRLCGLSTLPATSAGVGAADITVPHHLASPSSAMDGRPASADVVPETAGPGSPSGGAPHVSLRLVSPAPEGAHGTGGDPSPAPPDLGIITEGTSAASEDGSGAHSPAVHTSARCCPRVLVVDDSQSLRVMMARALKRLLPGSTVLQAANGALAVEEVRRATDRGQPFHAILMDHNMPVMDGDVAVRRLRAGGCDAIILGVTGNALAQDTAQFLAAGCTRVLTKPVDMEAIANMIGTHVTATLPASASPTLAVSSTAVVNVVSLAAPATAAGATATVIDMSGSPRGATVTRALAVGVVDVTAGAGLGSPGTG